MDMSMLVGIAVLLGFIAWASIRIVQQTRRHQRTSTLHWVALLVGLIGIDLWRMLEGFSPNIGDSNELIPFLACSFLVVICPPVGLAIHRYFVLRQAPDQPQASGEQRPSLAGSFLAARIAKACMVGVAAIVLLDLYSASLLLGTAYTYGISALPENRNPSGLTLPDLAVQVACVAELGSRPGIMEPCSNYDVIRLFFPRPVKKMRRPLVPFEPTQGYRAGHYAARRLLLREDQKVEDRMLWTIRQATAAIWVSRNWTADQAVRTILAESYYGNGCYGLDEASRGFFGCLPNELNLDEIALLVGLLQSPSADNPWRYPERAKKRIGFVLGSLAAFQGNDDAPRDVKLPSRLAATQRGWCGKNASEIGTEPDKESLRELMPCSSNGNLLKTKELLERGVDVNAKGWHCKTALMEASRHGQREVMGLLLDKGADVEARDDFYWTALMLGSRWGRLAAVKVLLNKGADVNAKDKWGETALVMASANGHTEVAAILKSHGAKE
jgi:hypothetical protein